MALLSVAMVILFPTSVYSVSVYASSPDEVPLATNFNKMFTLTKPTAGFFPIKKGVFLECFKKIFIYAPRHAYYERRCSYR